MKLNYVNAELTKSEEVLALVPTGKVTPGQLKSYLDSGPMVQALVRAELAGRQESRGPAQAIAFVTVGVTLLVGFALAVLKQTFDIIVQGGAGGTAAGAEFVSTVVALYGIGLVVVLFALAALYIWQTFSENRTAQAKARLYAYEGAPAIAIAPA